MLAVIDPRMPDRAKSRLKSICETVELPPFPALDKRIASHPDMLLFKLSENLFVCADYYKDAKTQIDYIVKQASLELHLTKDAFSHEYPNDVKFNAFVLNDFLIGRSEYISKDVKEYAMLLGIKSADTRQGYAKCSTVSLENAIISADKGICDVAVKLGCDALLISPGNVSLNGYDCGFIGGASGVYENRIFFCGDVTTHTDFDKIHRFCTSHGYKLISLSDEPLYDVGTIYFFDNVSL